MGCIWELWLEFVGVGCSWLDLGGSGCDWLEVAGAIWNCLEWLGVAWSCVGIAGDRLELFGIAQNCLGVILGKVGKLVGIQLLDKLNELRDELTQCATLLKTLEFQKARITEEYNIEKNTAAEENCGLCAYNFKLLQLNVPSMRKKT